MLRILVADDHPVVRRHIRNILQDEKDWVVCGEARTGREAVAMALAEHPDVVVLDLSMPELDGLQAARLIHEQFPETELILLTMHEPLELMDQLNACGVRTCIAKTDLSDLVCAVRELGRASPPALTRFSNRMSDVIDQSATPIPDATLTGVERKIVKMLAQSRSTKEIADALSLTVRGVENHRATIMGKLSISSILDLVHYALREKLVETRDK
jgi:DNA-binding NarL/FixJ family response regulator